MATGGSDSTVVVWDVRALVREAEARSLDELWQDLGSKTAGMAARAMASLAAQGEKAVAYVKEQVKPIGRSEEKRIEELIVALGSERFADRERAEKELMQHAFEAETLLRSNQDPDAEVRRRLGEVLEGLRRQPPGEESLRTVRGIEVLERIGGVEARKLLEALEGGATWGRRTREAKAALGRMK